MSCHMTCTAGAPLRHDQNVLQTYDTLNSTSYGTHADHVTPTPTACAMHSMPACLQALSIIAASSSGMPVQHLSLCSSLTKVTPCTCNTQLVQFATIQAAPAAQRHAVQGCSIWSVCAGSGRRLGVCRHDAAVPGIPPAAAAPLRQPSWSLL